MSFLWLALLIAQTGMDHFGGDAIVGADATKCSVWMERVSDQRAMFIYKEVLGNVEKELPTLADFCSFYCGFLYYDHEEE